MNRVRHYFKLSSDAEGEIPAINHHNLIVKENRNRSRIPSQRIRSTQRAIHVFRTYHEDEYSQTEE